MILSGFLVLSACSFDIGKGASEVIRDTIYIPFKPQIDSSDIVKIYFLYITKDSIFVRETK